MFNALNRPSAHPMLLLILPMLVHLSFAIGTVISPPRSEIVPYEHWNCGASPWDKSLSHQLFKEDCPKRMYEADLCCVVHDICYMDEHKGQQECDAAFCHCLERTVVQGARDRNHSSADSCEAVSSSFCGIVKLFGGMAFANSQQQASKEKAAMTAWEVKLAAEAAAKKASAANSTKAVPSTSTSSPTSTANTPPSPTTFSSSSTIATTSTTASPAEIGHFVTHKFPLDCLDSVLSNCTKRLHQCTAEQFQSGAVGSNSPERAEADALVLSAQLAECSTQFCECASEGLLASSGGGANKLAQQASSSSSPRWTMAKLRNNQQQPGSGECANHLSAICSQFADLPAQTPTKNVNIWSVNVNYVDGQQPLSLALATAGSLLLLVLLITVGIVMAKCVAFAKRRLCCQDESIRKNYAKASIRRNTLTALRSVGGAAAKDDDDMERSGSGGGPLYMPFGLHHQKDSTVSSPASSATGTAEAAAQKLLGGGGGQADSAGMHHNHKKAHSELPGATKVAKQLLHHQHMPLNSSQVHLIAGTGNSSSTLSDISSS